MIRKIANFLINLMLVFVLLLVIAFAGTRMVGLTPYTVTSGSMASIFPVGSMIYVKDISPEEVVVGDSITFFLGEKTVATHQVWEIDTEKQQFHTQGVDNLDAEGNIQKDARPVPFDELIGKPVFCIPKLGYAYEMMKTPVGLWMLAGISIATTILSFLVEGENEESVPTTSRRRGIKKRGERENENEEKINSY